MTLCSIRRCRFGYEETHCIVVDLRYHSMLAALSVDTTLLQLSGSTSVPCLADDRQCEICRAELSHLAVKWQI